MTKLFRLLAIPAVIAISGAAHADEPTRSFRHEGVTYVYEATPAADGSTILAGHSLPGGAPFRLVVKNGQVSGQANRQPVRFTVAGSRGAASGAVATSAPRMTAAD